MEYATKEDLRTTADELRGEIRAVGVIVEHMGSKIDALVEGFAGLREQMSSEMHGHPSRAGPSNMTANARPRGSGRARA